MVELDEFDFDLLINAVAGVVDDYHHAIRHVGYALVRVATGGGDFDFGVLARKVLCLEGESEFVEIKDVDLLSLGNFLEVIIVGEDEAAVGFGKFKEAVVDWGTVELVFDDGGIKIDYSFELADGFEAGAGAGALERVLTVSEKLELMSDATRDHDVVADEAGLSDRDEALIHERGGVNVDFALRVCVQKRPAM